MKVLNLYAGIGGNRKLWKDVEVTAVEYNPQIAEVYKDQHPLDTVVIGDAHDYLLNHFSEFDFIWSSPPCQANSRMIRSGRNRKPRYADLRLYEEVLLLQHDFKGLWVVENVVPYYTPLIKATQLGRHLLWSNFLITPFEAPKFKNFINRQNLTAKKQLQEWLGIHYEKNIYYEGNHCPTQILRNCVHPDMGLHIMNCALMHQMPTIIQQELFKQAS
ncbi:MAG TPA: DNA cytosine methyltransferase [Flavisolibacter sp.]|nr:DNA cytosine methyltransferase [Flavisolibacter sp.]